jgi:pimeloyl-ACP methyl ester carboxylesterase
MIWQQRGGRGETHYLLLHGLAATAAVWGGVCAALDEQDAGTWLACDLPGHGESAGLPLYSIGTMAAAIAATLEPDRPHRVIAHSLGVYIGLALASGWFGVRVASLFGIGPKVTWTESEIAAAQELARKPAKEFATEAEAWARFRKVSGLDERIAPAAATLARGVRRSPAGWRLAADSRTPGVAGAPFDSLHRSARCPVMLVRGERDPLVTLAELRCYRADATELPNTGHNTHAEAPAEIVALERRWRASQ